MCMERFPSVSTMIALIVQVLTFDLEVSVLVHWIYKNSAIEVHTDRESFEGLP